MKTHVLATVACGYLAGFLVFMAFMLLVGGGSMPRVVSCVDNRHVGMGDTPAGHTPATNVEVTTDRKGHIAERNLFGCTLYYYKAHPFR